MSIEAYLLLWAVFLPMMVIAIVIGLPLALLVIGKLFPPNDVRNALREIATLLDVEHGSVYETPDGRWAYSACGTIADGYFSELAAGRAMLFRKCVAAQRMLTDILQGESPLA